MDGGSSSKRGRRRRKPVTKAVSKRKSRGERRRRARALPDAIDAGDVDAVRKALAGGADPNREWPGAGSGTLLARACTSCPIEAVRLMLDAGAVVDGTLGYTRRTALHVACSVGNVELVDVLLAAGADDTTVDHNGATVLHFSCSRGSVELIQLLLERGANKDQLTVQEAHAPLHSACAAGNLEVMRVLINAGADLENHNWNGSTPLNFVCQKAGVHPEVVQLLLASGADFETTDKHGRTPLTGACMAGNLDVVKLLIRAGADGERVGGRFDVFSSTDGVPREPAPPLQVAQSHRHLPIVVLLEQWLLVRRVCRIACSPIPPKPKGIAGRLGPTKRMKRRQFMRRLPMPVFADVLSLLIL